MSVDAMRDRTATQPSMGRRYAILFRVFGRLATLVAAAACIPNAYAFDVFNTQADVPPTPTAGVVVDIAGCGAGIPTMPLRLEDAIDRAMCRHPETREAWANVKVQAAAVGVARAAYLPNVTANWQDVRDDQVTDVTGHPALSSAYRSSIHTTSVSLNWVLYDFGGRKAALRNARNLLAAARANQDVALAKVLATVAADYYAAQAAAGKFAAAQESEQTAHDSYLAAKERVSHGVAAIIDELTANTSYAQATFARVKAHGDLNTSLGTLAADMDLNPSIPIEIPPVDSGVKPDHDFSQSVVDLIRQAEEQHPSVAAAKAQLEAAVAKEQQTRAQGLPNLSFVAKYSNNNQPASLGLGEPQFPATGHDWYVGVQVQIPIFEGFGRTYQVRQAHAQVEVQQATLDAATQQVGLDVWKAYQALQADSENVANAASLADIAQRAFDAARHRYVAGVGNILELLHAQSQYADARQQWVQSMADWRAARLQLAAKLGRLDVRDWRSGAESGI